jgi:hypothetical protein
MLVAFMVYHPRTLTSRHGTWSLNVRNLSVGEFAYPPSFTAEQNEYGVGFSITRTSSHNSGLLHDPCRGVHEPRVSYMDAATNVSLACSAV